VIRYALRCADDHRFDSWFGSSADFDRLVSAGLVSCAVCGNPQVQKDMMAPSVASSGTEAQEEPVPTLSAPRSPAEQAMAELRRRIEARSENVGRDFAAEARRIHEGTSPERPIIGEAKPSEARALVEDGIPVAPLPWSSRKAN
jgi:hypothetical protein